MKDVLWDDRWAHRRWAEGSGPGRMEGMRAKSITDVGAIHDQRYARPNSQNLSRFAARLIG